MTDLSTLTRIDPTLQNWVEILQLKEKKHGEISNYVKFVQENGVSQRTADWEKQKRYTIGGSQIASVIGKNPYSKLEDVVADKLGITERKSNIQVLWGTVFEPIIKRYVEWDRDTQIIGDEMYINGKTYGTSYSPDGLCVIMTNYTTNGAKFDNIAPRPTKYLMEFKCPYSRIPGKIPPKYYIPQVQYGLDIIGVAERGIFAEAVFRRCKLDKLGSNMEYDISLGQELPKNVLTPLAYGFIGLAINEPVLTKSLGGNPHYSFDGKFDSLWHDMMELYEENYITGCSDNKFCSDDIGESPISLYTMLLKLTTSGVIEPYYSEIIYVAPRHNVIAHNYDHNNSIDVIMDQIAKFEKQCQNRQWRNLGVIPWKLFTVNYHFIDRQENFIDQYAEKIKQVIDTIKHCEKSPDKMSAYQQFMASIYGGFSM